MRIDYSQLKPGTYIGRRRRSRYPKWYRIPWLLPGELPGSVHIQYVKCGKPNCKCASGRREDKHPAYYRFWRDDAGKLCKAYVKRSELKVVREAIERRNARLRRQRTERNRHMRRGLGNGLAAHQWVLLNG